MNAELNLQKLVNQLQQLPRLPEQMPVLFVGHGNPMNAISDNPFTQSWHSIGNALPKPKAILSVSAHWLTHGNTLVHASKQPQTIHDFYGFPEELFAQKYPCSGSPEQAHQTQKLAPDIISETDEWGLDHGTWSVLLSMFPDADVPVYQISIDYRKAPPFHYQLAQRLQDLRKRGVLVIASGNLVHNLQKLQWNNAEPFDWALEFNQIVKEALADFDDQRLVNFSNFGALGKMAHPSYDHYLPLLYALGLRSQQDEIHFFNNVIDMSSVSMLSFIYLPRKV
ncbi:4,5-DOPA dioxygenase extradiol [Thiomicrorhabdus sp. 6S2-11]|uniref:4,5-DOPA dioxygenase extradiol n=1 Tax=Thiomicrorhabdus marina TaxID=2818442 RepID=A0ABS3Q5K4_9GAMM|nr:4,5-DOPA dioxygenase extradiol [Thiomicrorhabdus marina]MBO1927620.1 4,5-DOPA dioxygenase extradiol [Thiomicrorhabdus marina]